MECERPPSNGRMVLILRFWRIAACPLGVEASRASIVMAAGGL